MAAIRRRRERSMFVARPCRSARGASHHARARPEHGGGGRPGYLAQDGRSGDRGSTSEPGFERREKGRPTRRWTLVACVLASSLSFVEGSVLSVALPAIRASYGADAQQVQWVVNAYLLPLSALLLLGGALGDHFGRKRLLIIGTSIFAVDLAGLRAGAEPSDPARRARRARDRRGLAPAQQPRAAERGVPGREARPRGRDLGGRRARRWRRSRR